MQVRTRTTASFFPIGLVVLSMVADSRLTVSLRHVTGEHWEVSADAKYPGTCRSTMDFYFIEHSSRFTLVVHVCQSSHYPQTAVSHYLVITSLHRSGSLSLWTNLPPPSVHILAFIQLRSSGYRVNHPLFTSNFPVGLFLLLHHLSGIVRIHSIDRHTIVLQMPTYTNKNPISFSGLSPSSHPVPVPQIRSRFWRSTNVCM